MASKIASKTALASKLGFSTPRSPPGDHFDALGPRFWNLRELIFEASAASSGSTFACTFAGLEAFSNAGPQKLPRLAYPPLGFPELRQCCLFGAFGS